MDAPGGVVIVRIQRESESLQARFRGRRRGVDPAIVGNGPGGAEGITDGVVLIAGGVHVAAIGVTGALRLIVVVGGLVDRPGARAVAGQVIAIDHHDVRRGIFMGGLQKREGVAAVAGRTDADAVVVEIAAAVVGVLCVGVSAGTEWSRWRTR